MAPVARQRDVERSLKIVYSSEHTFFGTVFLVGNEFNEMGIVMFPGGPWHVCDGLDFVTYNVLRVIRK